MDSLNPQSPDPERSDGSPAHRYGGEAGMFASGNAPRSDAASSGSTSGSSDADFAELISSLEALEYDVPAGLADRIFVASAARLPAAFGRDQSDSHRDALALPFERPADAAAEHRPFSFARFARSAGPALAMAAVIGLAFVLSTRDNRGSAWDGIADGSRARDRLATASISPISFEGSPSEAVLAALLRTPEDADQWPAASLVSHASTRDVLTIVELRETSLDDLLEEFSRIESHASRPAPAIRPVIGR